MIDDELLCLFHCNTLQVETQSHSINRLNKSNYEVLADKFSTLVFEFVIIVTNTETTLPFCMSTCESNSKSSKGFFYCSHAQRFTKGSFHKSLRNLIRMTSSTTSLRFCFCTARILVPFFQSQTFFQKQSQKSFCGNLLEPTLGAFLSKVRRKKTLVVSVIWSCQSQKKRKTSFRTSFHWFPFTKRPLKMCKQHGMQCFCERSVRHFRSSSLKTMNQ